MELATLQRSIERFDMLLLVHGGSAGSFDAWVLIKQREAEEDFFVDWMADAAQIRWRGATGAGARLCAVGRISEALFQPASKDGLMRRVEAVVDHLVRATPSWTQQEGFEDTLALPSAEALATAKALVGWSWRPRAKDTTFVEDVLAADTDESSALIFAADDMWMGLF
jgi:hypothetical protein